MNVNEIFIAGASLIGTIVQVEGTFIMTNEVAHFVRSDDEQGKTSPGIGIAVEDLKSRLYSTVPALGGSKYSYCHKASAVGVLEQTDSETTPFMLANVSKLVFFLRDMEFVVV